MSAVKIVKRPNQLAAERLLLKLADYANVSPRRVITEKQRRHIAHNAEDIEQLHILNMSVMAAVLSFLEIEEIEWKDAAISSKVRESAITPYIKRVDDLSNHKAMARLDPVVVKFDLYTTFIRYLVLVSLSVDMPPPPLPELEEGEEGEEGTELSSASSESEDEDEEEAETAVLANLGHVPRYGN